jgi:hypothetical protein
MRNAKVVTITVNLGDNEHELDVNMTLAELREIIGDHGLGEWSSLVVVLLPMKEGEDDNISAQ